MMNKDKAYMMTDNNFISVGEDVSSTLMARDYKAPPIVAVSPEETYVMAFGQANATITTDKASTLTTINDQQIVCKDKTIRRITPLECCRLQGFPDDWCEGLEIENPTEEDLEFWRQVFETHRKAVSHTAKPKTDNQIKKWLMNHHTDSAEYKMWGNGVALPCVERIMQGIVAYENSKTDLEG